VWLRQCPVANRVRDGQPATEQVVVGHGRVGVFHGLAEGVVRVDDQRGEQIVAAWEVPVDRGRDHAEVSRHRSQRQVGPVGGEVPPRDRLDLFDHFGADAGADRAGRHEYIVSHREHCS
jgi:hypothetical protein